MALFPATFARASGYQTGAPWPKRNANQFNAGVGVATGASNVEKWSFSTNQEVFAQPIVGGDGTVYVGCGDDNFYAIDGATGGQKWTFQTSGQINGSAAIGADGTVYFGSFDGNFYAVDSATGQQVWSMSTYHAIDSSPTIGPDGTVYIYGGDYNLYALNGKTGAVIYTSEFTFDALNLAMASNGFLYASSSQAGDFYGIQASTGVIEWDFHYDNPEGGGFNCSIGSDGTVYFGAQNGVIYALNGQTGVQKWSFSTTGGNPSATAVLPNGSVCAATSVGELYDFDPSTGAQNWLYTGSGFFDDPIVGSDGTVYISNAGVMTAFNGSSGAVEWTFQGDTGAESACIGADGTLYVSSDDSQVFALGKWIVTHYYFSPPAVTGGQGTRGVVQIQAPAPPGGLVVSLANDDASIVVPSSVTIPTGKTGVSFPIGSTVVAASTTHNLKATFFGSSAQGSLTIEPYGLSNFYAAPSTITGSKPTYGVVQLKGSGGPGGNTVSLQSSSACVVVPASITVSQGKSGISFGVGTKAVSAVQSVTLKATFNSVSLTATVTVSPFPLAHFYTSVSQVTGGQSLSGVVQLAGPAGPEGNVVSISGGEVAVRVPANATVAAGASGVSFAIGTSIVSSIQSVSLSAGFNGSSMQSSFTVNPYLVSKFYVSPSQVMGGKVAYGVVQLAGPAGPGGNVVSLTSGSSTVKVPSSVTLPSGKTGVSFEMSTGAVLSSTQVTITAVFAGRSNQATVTVTP